MRFLVLGVLAFVALCGQCSAALMLVNTGTGTGTSWTMTGSGTIQDVTVTNSAWQNQVGSSWISNVTNAQTGISNAGVYEFTTSFTPTNAGPGWQVGFGFDMLYDNGIVVQLVNSSGTTTLFDSLGASNFTLPASSVSYVGAAVAGLNTLVFRVTNDALPLGSPVGTANPVGLNVNFTSQSNDVVPEPTSMALFGGLLGLGMVFRRRK